MSIKERSDKAAKETSLTLISRLALAVQVALGRGPQWFGPGQSPTPTAPEDVAGRQMDYPVHTNMLATPRADEPISFAKLRAFADNYDVLRTVIETRKDQMARQNWIIKPRDKKAGDDVKKRAEEATKFFAYPDKEHAWDEWLRMLLEDLFVIDAPCVYVRKTNGGQLYGFEPMDGSTIKVQLNGWGRRPQPPETAYVQQLKGLPAVAYTTEELIYRPRNPRTHKVYGYSPVEQIILTIQTALRRELSQFEYFESGTLPDAIATLPETWTADQIKDFQKYFDLLLADQSEKRKLRFLPAASDYKEVKQPPLKDMFDEWLARVVCYAFSVEVTPFVAQVNRSVAESAQKQAATDGLIPVQRWVKNFVDIMILKTMGVDDLEFAWEEEEEVDAKTQAEIDQIYLNCNVVSVEEVRDRLGMEVKKSTPESEQDPALVTDPAAAPKTGEPGAQPVDPNAPPAVPGAAPVAAAGVNVQATALNGTQISSLQAMIQSAADKALPPETVEAMIGASFPMLDPAQIKAMLTPLKNFEPVKPEPAVPFGQEGGEPGTGDEDGAKPAEGEDADAGKEKKGKVIPFPAKGPVAKSLVGGDLHVHVSVEAPVVDVAGTNVHLHNESTKLTKTITARRDPLTGELIGTITEEPGNE